VKAKAKKKLGRPLRAAAPSAVNVKARVTLRESAALRKAAKAAGVSLSDFIRAALDKAAKGEGKGGRADG
jgi:predicted HicB family RNase H-like nuclease